MTLLQDIQAGALDSNTSLPDLLRKCKVLAARLKHEEFAAWVAHELNGYDNTASLPAYRLLPTISKGNFLDPLGGMHKNANIAVSELDEDFEIPVDRLNLATSVAGLTNAKNSGQAARVPWPPDLVVYLRHRIRPGSALSSAWWVLTPSQVEGVLDTVRTRILDFALEIENENPAAGEASLSDPPPIPKERVQKIYNQYVIHGDLNDVTGQQFTRNKSVTVNQYNVSFGSAVPLEHHEELKRLLTELRAQVAQHAESDEDRTEALSSVERVESQLAKDDPNPVRIKQHIQLIAAIVGAAAPTLEALSNIFAQLGLG